MLLKFLASDANALGSIKVEVEGRSVKRLVFVFQIMLSPPYNVRIGYSTHTVYERPKSTSWQENILPYL